MTSAARRLVRRLDELGRVSDERGRLTRTFLSPAMRQANHLVGSWMREAGLLVMEDEVGNLIGRRPSPRTNPKTLILGSHLDTVVGAGRFDGALGVVLAVTALEELSRRRVTLPFDIEVVGFSEEEGVRFGSAYLGSKGYSGSLRRSDLAKVDAQGLSVRQALEAHHRRPIELPRSRFRRRDLLGYLEVHIEQGPVLEELGLGLGVVTAIAGQSRIKLRWVGKAGHAGTTPMKLRRDALAGAAELAVAAEALALATPGLVATIGTWSVKPGAGNVIPGEVVHSLDVRHARDAVKARALARLEARARSIAARRGLALDWRLLQSHEAVTCSSPLSALLAATVRAHQGSCPKLASGAGHDGVILSRLAPIAMLFVRCRDGLSHHPDEFASTRDLEAALAATVGFLERLATREAPMSWTP